jgi:hypothetical protein
MKIKPHPLYSIFKHAAEYGINANQLFVLASIGSKQFESNEYITDAMTLIAEGFLTPEFKITEKGENLLIELGAYFKAQKQGKIKLDNKKVAEYNELYPQIKLPSGKYARCTIPELCSAFDWFFKTYPEYANWDLIMKATRIYLLEREAEDWNYTRRSKYFVRKQMMDKSFESDLAEYCSRINAGIKEPSINNSNNKGFEERVV